MIKTFIFAICILFIFPSAKAADYAYYPSEPSIKTNYITGKKKMGFIRFSFSLMIEKADNFDIVQHHAPLLQDAIVVIIGQQPESKIKSINGKHEIIRLCEDKIKSLLEKETGEPLIKKLLFTEWLFDT